MPLVELVSPKRVTEEKFENYVSAIGKHLTYTILLKGDRALHENVLSGNN